MKPFSIPKTIRGRLILWFSAGAVAIFSVLTIFLSVFIRSILEQQIDHHIHIVTGEARQIVGSYQGKARDDLLSQLVGSEGMTVVLLSSDGAVLLQTNSSDVAKATQPQLETLLNAPTNPDTERYHFTIGSQRFMTTPVKVNNINGVLAVGYSVKVLEDSFRNLLILLIFAMTITLLLILIGIKNIVDKSLMPLEVISQKARSVSSSRNLTISFPNTNQTEEINSLTTALNTMTGKLKHVFDTEHEFFESAAHTIKTPLAVARSKVEAFSKVANSDKELVMASLDKVSETVKDLLIISRLETRGEQYENKLPLSGILEELIAIAEALTVEKTIAVYSSIEPNIFVKGNEPLLKRALSNIVQNAVNYTPKGGSITISLSCHLSNKDSELDLQSGQNDIQQAVLTITDTGIGISKKDQKHIFERFYRGNNVPVNNGNGLGLAITKAAIEQMNGRIFVQSKLNKGTTFKIYLQSLS